MIVVDDDARVRETFVDLLRAAGYEVESASDGAGPSAIQRVEAKRRSQRHVNAGEGWPGLIVAIRRLSKTVEIIAMWGVWQRAGVTDQAVALGAAVALLKLIDLKLLYETAVESVARRPKR